MDRSQERRFLAVVPSRLRPHPRVRYPFSAAALCPDTSDNPYLAAPVVRVQGERLSERQGVICHEAHHSRRHRRDRAAPRPPCPRRWTRRDRRWFGDEATFRLIEGDEHGAFLIKAQIYVDSEPIDLLLDRRTYGSEPYEAIHFAARATTMQWEWCIDHSVFPSDHERILDLVRKISSGQLA